jgi:hypothetical protein
VMAGRGSEFRGWWIQERVVNRKVSLHKGNALEHRSRCRLLVLTHATGRPHLASVPTRGPVCGRDSRVGCSLITHCQFFLDVHGFGISRSASSARVRFLVRCEGCLCLCVARLGRRAADAKPHASLPWHGRDQDVGRAHGTRERPVFCLPSTRFP